MNKLFSTLLLLGLISSPVMAKNILDKLTAAPGFEISLFADDVENARQIAVSSRGIVYAGSRKFTLLVSSPRTTIHFSE